MYTTRIAWIPTVLLFFVASCGTMNTDELIPGGVGTSLLPSCTSPGSVSEFSARSTTEVAATAQEVEARSSQLRGNLPDSLKNDVVIRELLKASAVASYRGNVQAARMLRINAKDLGQEPPLPENLNEWDFRRFAENMRSTMLSAPLTLNNVSTMNSLQAQPDFYKAVILYFNSYYKGEYMDRFGNQVAKPKLSQNISDDEIAGAVTVFADLLVDYTLRTPVWQDQNCAKSDIQKDNKNGPVCKTNTDYLHYYPGNFSTRPTVLDAPPDDPAAAPPSPSPIRPGLVSAATVLLTPDESLQCGITPLKAEAIQYLSSLSANQAGLVAGSVGGSFGGLHFGFGILGKWSIGDNKTLQTIVDTALSRVFERSAEEVSYRVLNNIGYDKSINDLATFLQNAFPKK